LDRFFYFYFSFILKHICHLSLLNPVNHPRIYHKYAKSQLQEGFRLSICGKKTSEILESSIQFYTHPDFHRLSVFRLWYNIRLFFKVISLSPNVCFIHTPELLWIACVLSVFSKTKWIYDVHEKYEDNIRYHPGWAKKIRNILAWGVVTWERISVRYFLTAVVYAEKGFQNHLQAQNFFVLPNGIEVIPVLPHIPDLPEPYLLVSGNIAENWGSLEALRCFEMYFSKYYQLVYIGKCPNDQEQEKLTSAIEKSHARKKIKIIGLNTYVPHEEILAWTEKAAFLCCLYANNPAIANRLPTKMMEAWHYQIPIIFTPIPNWCEWNASFSFGLSSDHIENLSTQVFYPQPVPSIHYLWQEMYFEFQPWFHSILR